MSHWKTILTYDGTPYNGWQVQPNLSTVQGTLADAIRHVTGESVLPQGSGRTDTGVHALGQVATFSLTVPIPAANLHHALNRALPSSIRVLTVEQTPEDFHARHSAIRKTYEYRILSGNQICSPMLAPYVWACHLSLDLAALQQAAAHILGIHDFTSFSASDPDLATRNGNLKKALDEESVISTEGDDSAAITEKPTSPPLAIPNSKLPAHATNARTIHHSAWHQQHDLLIYTVTGSGFLHHMVRNLVGTFVEAAAGRISPDAIPVILAARDRSTTGPTAPARGLFLVKVDY